MITLESLQEINGAAKIFDQELEKLISYDWSESNIIDAATMNKFRAERRESSDKIRQEVKEIKQKYIKSILPQDFRELLPVVKVFGKDLLEKELIGVDLLEALDVNNPEHLTMPDNTKNYSIEYKLEHNQLDMSNPTLTMIDNETGKKYVINCGICNVDWLKILNLNNIVNNSEFKIACDAIKDKNGVIKIDCKDGVLKYSVETQVENKQTHQLEKKQITRDNFYELMLTVVEQYHNKISDFIDFVHARKKTT